MKTLYPCIKKLGLKIINDPYPHIPSSELNIALVKNGFDIKKFNEFFGCQTCLYIEKGKYKGQTGLYPYDVEAVLVRMKTGKLTGTQLFWD